MDSLRLLSRGTKTRNKQVPSQQHTTPSGEDGKPQLFTDSRPTKKRRTDAFESDEHKAASDAGKVEPGHDPRTAPLSLQPRSIQDRKALLKQHKIKVAWLKPPAKDKESNRSQSKAAKKIQSPLFPDPICTFDSLDTVPDVPPWLVNNVRAQGYREATEVQMAAIPILSAFASTYTEDGSAMLTEGPGRSDLLTIAPTGSGKTLAFYIPTLIGISAVREDAGSRNRSTRALILAPTKELVGQIVNEGKTLVRGSRLKISAYKKDMRLQNDEAEEDSRTVARPDILVSTPGILHAAIDSARDGHALLPDVQFLILDEADVLLDPLFRQLTVAIWNSLQHADLRASLWSATMGSNIEDLASLIIEERRRSIKQSSTAPFVRLVVGLKDSALPNIQHRLIYAATEQGKLMGLRQLLHPSSSSADVGQVLRPPFIVFTQTIERAIALHSELLYDIPAEAGGISRIAVLHSDLSDAARDAVMTRFRTGEIWVLITTDLLSRGIDFRGVNGVVNYDIPSSSAAYVHRAGRTGRAGREGGVAVTLYSKEDIPYLKHVANVIAAAQKDGVTDGTGIQQWLLDALPTLSRNDKQKFKKHGLEARTARAVTKDPKAARKARISTKPGFLRREENNRKGAIEGSRRRTLDTDVDGFENMDFATFD